LAPGPCSEEKKTTKSLSCPGEKARDWERKEGTVGTCVLYYIWRRGWSCSPHRKKKGAVAVILTKGRTKGGRKSLPQSSISPHGSPLEHKGGARRPRQMPGGRICALSHHCSLEGNHLNYLPKKKEKKGNKQGHPSYIGRR